MSIIINLIAYARHKASETVKSINQATCKHSYGPWMTIGKDRSTITQICRCPKCDKTEVRWYPVEEHITQD